MLTGIHQKSLKQSGTFQLHKEGIPRLVQTRSRYRTMERPVLKRVVSHQSAASNLDCRLPANTQGLQSPFTNPSDQELPTKQAKGQRPQLYLPDKSSSTCQCPFSFEAEKEALAPHTLSAGWIIAVATPGRRPHSNNSVNTQWGSTTKT